MKLAVLCVSRMGVAFDWHNVWSATFEALRITHRWHIHHGGSDLQIARSLVVRDAFESQEPYTHALWLDDDIMPPQTISEVRDHLEACDQMDGPVGGLFVRRGNTSQVIGMRRMGGEAGVRCNTSGRRYTLEPYYLGLGCTAVRWDALETVFRMAPLVDKAARLRLICCPSVKGEGTDNPVYLSEDYAFCERFPESHRVNIGYGHYAKNSLVYPVT